MARGDSANTGGFRDDVAAGALRRPPRGARCSRGRRRRWRSRCRPGAGAARGLRWRDSSASNVDAATGELVRLKREAAHDAGPGWSSPRGCTDASRAEAVRRQRVGHAVGFGVEEPAEHQGAAGGDELAIAAGQGAMGGGQQVGEHQRRRLGGERGGIGEQRRARARPRRCGRRCLRWRRRRRGRCRRPATPRRRGGAAAIARMPEPVPRSSARAGRSCGDERLEQRRGSRRWCRGGRCRTRGRARSPGRGARRRRQISHGGATSRRRPTGDGRKCARQARAQSASASGASRARVLRRRGRAPRRPSR